MVHFGVHAGPQECTIDELRAVWTRTEEWGFEWLSVWDHFYPAHVGNDADCFEAVACQAAMAALTTRVRIGCLVYSAGYRHPAVLANAGATIDHLAGGRFEMGLGAGWHQAEYEAYGMPFESPAVRLRRLAESVEIVRLLWTQDVVDYDGEFWTLRGARCNTKPVQQPSPRIWVGATGPRALRQAGRIGDAWNTPFASPEDYARKLELVMSECPDPERFATGVNLYLVMGDDDPEEALRRRFGAASPGLLGGTLVGSPDQVEDRVRQYVAAGAQWINIALRAPFDLASLERFATEVMPRLRA
ncbi:MAG: LLM class flavin-dependent oxidoreductase [Acidobacteria bacterium]|nr:LLM class flavin-dependent oxidoreductase [Acidobacteriota bacterium]